MREGRYQIQRAAHSVLDSKRLAREMLGGLESRALTLTLVERECNMMLEKMRKECDDKR